MDGMRMRGKDGDKESSMVQGRSSGSSEGTPFNIFIKSLNSFYVLIMLLINSFNYIKIFYN